MFFKCANCCPACTLCSDDFNRAASDTVGSGWREELGDWDVVTTAPGEGAVENQSSTSILCRDTTCGASPPDATVTIDVAGVPTVFPASSQVSIKWTPLSTAFPCTQRLWLGSSTASSGAIQSGIFLEVEYATRSSVSTLVIRLGSRTGGTDTWISDEVPCGDGVPVYTSGSSWSSGEPQQQLTLCWKPNSYYGSTARGSCDVIGSLETPTGTKYTVEGTSYDTGDRLPILSSSAGFARWDDFVWSLTATDTPSCPQCGTCLFAKDTTTAADATTAAYSSVGGTIARNVTTGAVELTSTVATWIVDIPRLSSVSFGYVADWAGSSPTMTVAVGSVSLTIAKDLGQQKITPTVNGSLKTAFYVPLASDYLTICHSYDDVLIDVDGTRNEYTTTVNSGYTNLSITAGSVLVSLSEIVALRTSASAVTDLDCLPCYQGSLPVDCSVCPPEPFAPYGSIVANVALSFSTRPLYYSCYAVAPGLGNPCAGVLAPLTLSVDPTFLPDDIMADDIQSGGPAIPPKNVDDIALCSWVYNESQTTTHILGSTSGQAIVSGNYQFALYKTTEVIPRYYLTARSNANLSFVPGFSCGVGTFYIWQCDSGLVSRLYMDGTFGAFPATTNYTTFTPSKAPAYYYSDYFTDCSQTDFTLSIAGGDTVMRKAFFDVTYPSTITVEVIR